jgi:LuxR family transcriptional regulator, maltose regulon positive regulatory protein
MTSMRPAAAAAAGRAVEPDVLLATKLHVPQPRPGFLARPRLLDRLAVGVAQELTLVCAPAGFGKTSLLGDWARRARQPVAWLSLDAGDSDPVRFWRYVAAALDGAGIAAGGRLAPLLRGPQPASLETVVTALINELAAQDEEVVLVLDDYHLIEATTIHDSLTLLLDRAPPVLRLLLASRADPPLPLARLRVRGQLVELRERDLRFTTEETAALLRQTTGVELSAASLAALAARTEGWVAGLQLAGLSLQGHADPAGFVATFTGSNRYVLDYLAEEVLDRQPEPLRGFLLETSVLERLSGPLCDAVTGRSDSQQLLERAERANLFLVPLDGQRRWWRYHHLFADLLRARLVRAHPERVAELHHAAAAWCERHGLVDEAIGHALAAGDEVWAAGLVERHFDALLRRAEGATVDRWVEALPAELVGSRPRLLVAQAVWALLGGRVDEAEPLLDHAEAALAASGDEPYEPSVGRAASRVANLPASIALTRAELARRRGDAERIEALARQALAHLSEDERALRRQVDWFLAVANWYGGRLTEAEHALIGLLAEQRAAGEGYLALRAACDLGQVQRARGRLSTALATYGRALQLAGEAGSPSPPAGMAHVGMAEVLYERGELEAALDHATEGVRLCRQLTYTLPLLAGLAVLARVRQARGDAPGVLAAVREAERVQQSPAVVGLLNPVPPLRARLALAHGQVEHAARWVHARKLAPDDQPSYPRERAYLILARLLLAEQAPTKALELLQRLGDLAAAQQRTGSLIEVRVLRALALAAKDKEPDALAALAEAITLAAPEGYTRVFLDEGAPLAALLDRLAAAGRWEQVAPGTSVPTAYLRQLREAFHPAAPVARVAARPAAAGPLSGLVEPLSERELEVLGLLAAGRSNREIAAELVVALDTVKKHVSHVLDKLGAANRTQAVARARELGLLQ